MTRADDKRSLPVSEQAAEWLVAFDGRDPGAQEKREFLAWLKESPAHIREFLQLSALHAELLENPRIKGSINELVAAARTDVIDLEGNSAPRPRHEQTAQAKRPHWWGIAAMLVLGVATVTLLWIGQGAGQTGQVYRTELGEQRSISLEDGSVITLNTLSEVHVRFTTEARRVTLSKGEALFDVAKDPSRPFRVDAGPMQFTAVGTRFNLYRQATQTVLTVVEGRVAVEPIQAPAGRDRPAPTAPLVASAGEQVAVANDSVLVNRESVPEVEASTAWTQRKLVFNDSPLATVAEEFNRYNRRRLVIDDQELGSRLITGVFNAHDTELLARFLKNQPDIQVDQSADVIHVHQPNRK